MTIEKFDQACEIKQNIDNAYYLKFLLLNYNPKNYILETRSKKDNTKISNTVNDMPEELLAKLKQACKDYIAEQQELFEKI
jgi:hypothetical protein